MVRRSVRVLALVVAIAGAGVPGLASAVFEPRDFASPEHEQRYRALIEELRCLVCQNQNIADSNADLASDLRREVYRMVEDDRSADEIAGFMVARYGEFVLYRPAFRVETVFLWVGPFGLVAAGLAALFLRLRRHRRAPPAPIDDETRAHVRRLLDDNSR